MGNLESADDIFGNACATQFERMRSVGLASFRFFIDVGAHAAIRISRIERYRRDGEISVSIHMMP